MNRAERTRLLRESQRKYPGIDQAFPEMTREEMRAANREVVNAINLPQGNETSSDDGEKDGESI